MLAAGHIQSVMGYRKVRENYIWEISTIHTKQPKLYSLLLKSLITEEEQKLHFRELYCVGTISFDMIQSLANQSDQTKMPDFQKFPGDVEYKHNELKIQINQRDCWIRFSLKPPNRKHELDSVKGIVESPQVSYVTFVYSVRSSLQIPPNLKNRWDYAKCRPCPEYKTSQELKSNQITYRCSPQITSNL